MTERGAPDPSAEKGDDTSSEDRDPTTPTLPQDGQGPDTEPGIDPTQEHLIPSDHPIDEPEAPRRRGPIERR